MSSGVIAAERLLYAIDEIVGSRIDSGIDPDVCTISSLRKLTSDHIARMNGDNEKDSPTLIKKLDWWCSTLKPSVETDVVSEAQTRFGTIYIKSHKLIFSRVYNVESDIFIRSHSHKSIEAAKASAQSQYEKMIRECLE